MPAEDRGNRSKRRRMYFRETSKRDSNVPPEVEEQNYRQAFCQYCSDCMEKYGLQSGKIGIRRLGVCSICGKDEFISGCLGNDNPLVFTAHEEWTREYMPDVPIACFVVHAADKCETVRLPIPKTKVVKIDNNN